MYKNELAVSVSESFDLACVDESNYLAMIDRIKDELLVTRTNERFSYDKIMSLYQDFVIANGILPSVDDIEEEVSFYNMTQLEQVAEIRIGFDKDLMRMLNTEQGRLQLLGPSCYDSEEDMMEDVRSTIVSEHLQELWSFREMIEKGDIFEILNDANVAFYLGFDDNFYETFTFLGEFQTSILVNDAQQTMIPEFGWDYYQMAYCYTEKDAESMPQRNYILIRNDQMTDKKLLNAGGYAS